MNNFTLSSMIAFVLVGMGMISLSWGLSAWSENRKSKSAKKMLGLCCCVFFWNYGYAWMSMCHGDERFALIARAIALFSIIMYMFFTIDYVSYLSKYPRQYFILYTVVVGIASFVAWTQIIKPDAVTFIEVPWGFWYTSRMTWARILQFSAIFVTIGFYYVILRFWKKQATNTRTLYIIRRFMWFGPILIIGYTADTLLPILFHTAAIPGSSIAAFFSAALLFKISKAYEAFDVTIPNVSQYVFRDVSTPVLIFNESGKPVLINKQTEDYFGMRKNEILLYNISNLFTASETFEDLYEIAGEKPEDHKYYKIDTTDILDQFGELLYIIVFITDMTAEQSTINELNESRLAAETANQAKSNFLANMSHEIRTPLNAILGMSDIILMDDNISDSIRNNVLDIKTAGNGLLEIINDILNISKIESGKLEIFNDEYNVPDMIQEICSIMTIQTKKHNLAFITNIDPTLPTKMIGDETRIKEILINIIGNATKFTKDGSVTLFISWNNIVENPVITLSVTDTGIGIKKEDLASIFGAFNQVDTRKNREVEGTGLGLAISKKLAMLMGGDISVQSTYGRGSTFTITIRQKIDVYIPIGRDTVNAISQNAYRSAEKEIKPEYTDNSKKKILIVDDNVINLKVASGILKPYNMQISAATSGKEAIELVKNNNFDLIFMDHMMPEMDGVDTTKYIRQMDDGKYANIPIIALTANALKDSQAFLLENGMQDFLAKPIVISELDKIIKKWL